MKKQIKMKIKWCADVIEMHEDEFSFDGKQKHLKRIIELKAQKEVLESLL